MFWGTQNKCQPQMLGAKVEAKVEMFYQREIGLYDFIC